MTQQQPNIILDQIRDECNAEYQKFAAALSGQPNIEVHGAVMALRTKVGVMVHTTLHEDALLEAAAALLAKIYTEDVDSDKITVQTFMEQVGNATEAMVTFVKGSEKRTKSIDPNVPSVKAKVN